jgi:hypothetical protein
MPLNADRNRWAPPTAGAGAVARMRAEEVQPGEQSVHDGAGLCPCELGHVLGGDAMAQAHGPGGGAVPVQFAVLVPVPADLSAVGDEAPGPGYGPHRSASMAAITGGPLRLT